MERSGNTVYIKYLLKAPQANKLNKDKPILLAICLQGENYSLM